MQKEKHYKTIFYSSLATAIITSICFAQFLYGETNGDNLLLNFLKSSALIQYAAVLLCFASVFFGMRFLWWLGSRISKRFADNSDKETRHYSARFSNGVVLIFIALALFLILQWYFHSLYEEFAYSTSMPVQQVPFFSVVVLVAIVLIFVARMIYKGKDISKFCLVGIYVLCLVMVFAVAYCPSFFRSDLYHKVAATETIFNVFDLVPFSEKTSGIYGHYGLFFILPMLSMGGTAQTVSVLMALFCVISYGAIFYVIHNVLEKNWARALMACASIVCETIISGGQYYQVRPVRILFPALFCAYYIFLQRREIKAWGSRYMFLGYFLGAMSIIWNTETGAICTISFSAYLIVEEWRKSYWYQIRCLKKYFCVGVMSLGAGILAWGVVNIYNLACGGHLIFRAFFYPLFENNNIVDRTRYDMISGNHPWVYTLVLFFLITGWGLSRTSFFRNSDDCTDNYAAPSVAIGILGLLVISYYVNRAAFGNLAICYPTAICALSLLLHYCRNAVSTWKCKNTFDIIVKRIVGALTMLVACIMASQLFLFPIRLQSRKAAQIWDIKDIKTDIYAIGDSIGDNTYGVGMGIAEIYHMLGNTNYAHLQDASDWGLTGDSFYDYMAEEIVQNENILFSMCLEERGIANKERNILKRVLERNPEYVLSDIFYVADSWPFYYWEDTSVLEEGDIIAEHSDFSLDIEEDLAITYLPVELRSDTVYKITLSLSEDFDFSIFENMYIDFYGGEAYDNDLQQVQINFLTEGKYDYVFYINAGDVETVDDSTIIYARIFGPTNENFVSTTQCGLEYFCVTEME